jgi:hypothetical protein
VGLADEAVLERIMVTRTNDGSDTEYAFSDYAGTDPLYIGSVAADGSWLIEQFSSSAKTMRYCVGSSGYATNWTNRAGLTYSLCNEV